MTDVQSLLSDYFSANHPRDAVISAYLFGSHARGGAHADSDVDVAVLLDRQQLPDRDARSRFALRLNTDLIAATHCNDVDVVVLGDVSPELAARARCPRRTCSDARVHACGCRCAGGEWLRFLYGSSGSPPCLG